MFSFFLSNFLNCEASKFVICLMVSNMHLVILHLVIEYNWLYELGAHKFFFCPLCHCCYIPCMWIRIRVYVWRWASACKCGYTYIYVLVLTYISVHMGIVNFLLHIMYYLWMLCPMHLLFNFGKKRIFIVIVIVILIKNTLPLMS